MQVWLISLFHWCPVVHHSFIASGDFGNVKYLFAPNNVEGVDEFEIDLDSGNMTVRNGPLLDFEKKRTYSFFVEARDYYRSTLSNLMDLIIFPNYFIGLLFPLTRQLVAIGNTNVLISRNYFRIKTMQNNFLEV